MSRTGVCVCVCEYEREETLRERSVLETFIWFTRPYKCPDVVYVCSVVEPTLSIVKPTEYLRIPVWLRERGFPDRVG